MVYEVNIYLKSIVLTVFVFFIGIMVGILLDTLRVGEIKKAISESEIRWEDIRLLNVYLGKIGEK
ncbi:hypothetical protein KEJ33_06315, partial [Candidatus Bathyarchaeota archaeon]|nr:hypothetical protein [Candidatus Bathyarchaeota archaeon]